MLQPLRDIDGRAICVNSGFRQLTGEAADMKVVDNALLFQLIYDHLPFDKLIWEGGNNYQPAWVHVSYRAEHNRKEVLKMREVSGKKKSYNR